MSEQKEVEFDISEGPERTLWEERFETQIDLFFAEAIDRVYNATQGIPRMVNKLCDFSMLYAATEGREVVTGEAVDEVLADGIFISSFEQLEDAAQ